MATLAVDTPRDYDSGVPSLDMEGDVIASDIIYEGSAVGESSSTGTYRPFVASDNFVGFASEQANNSSGSASDIRVKIRQQGIIEIPVAGATAIANDGEAVYASDDNTFTTTASGATQIGKIVSWLTGTTCRVFFQGVNVRSV